MHNPPRRPVGACSRRDFLKSSAALGTTVAAGTPVRGRSDENDRERIMIGYVWRLSSTPGGNIGDYSITPGLVTLLNRHFPAYRVTAIDQHRGGDVAERIDNTLQGFPECDVVGDAVGDAYKAAFARLQQECGGSLPPVNDRNIDLVFERFAAGVADELNRNYPRFVACAQETRLLVYTSGMIAVYGEGTLAGANFWGYSIRRSMPLLAAWKLGVPYGIYAHSFDSFGPADGPGQPYFKRLLEDAQFVFCRDGSSVKYVQSLQIAAPHLMFVPDSTVSAERRDDAWAEEFMTRHGLESKRFLVVIPRTWQGGGVISSAIGRARSLSHMGKLREVVQQWVQRTGMKVVVGAEVARDLPNARAFVYDQLPAEVRCQCVMLDPFWTTEQAVALYRRTRIVVTMEMHSFLMAIPQGTPTVVPCFQESGRKISMLEDFQLSDWLFDIDQASAQQIGLAVAAIHDNYQRQTERLEREVIPHLRRRERRAIEIIGQSLAKRP